MPPLDLAPIRARAEAATEGPWHTDGMKVRDSNNDAVAEAWWWSSADAHGLATAAFIAAARSDVTALLDEVERLRDMLHRLVRAVNFASTEAAGPGELADLSNVCDEAEAALDAAMRER